MSASADGVKRAVLGSRKDSSGSVKKVEGMFNIFRRGRYRRGLGLFSIPFRPAN